ncbi:MAG TPA: ABC transporter substrate-binding protein [Solirubrobacteraceae bacterium]|jgi:ABC-type nitrate/sulfonate/bicarbonate transport system substrate-binding protein|nr:ABC transporter substrate-binding protein [Solirubrobacteraceae bacterium]
MIVRRVAAALALVAAVALAGCGAASRDIAPNTSATLLLDAAPNAVHAGIYTAVARGYDDALGVNLRIRPPSAATDATKLLASGRVPLAILDIHDLAIARERGRDLVAVMAVVQQPLAAIFAQPLIGTARELEGRYVGVGDRPSDDAVLRTIVTAAGGDPAKVGRTALGSGAVPGILDGRLAAATGSWNVEGVALHAAWPDVRELRLGDHGAPAFPELVLATARATLRDEPGVVRAAVQALARGYAEVLSDPESAVSSMLAARRGLDRATIARQLDAVAPALTAGARVFGELDPGRLRAWARWERRFEVVRRVPDVRRAFDGRYVPRSGSRD